MKVLHILKTSNGGGWALRLMRELVALGVEVHVALPTDGILIPEYRKYGITIHKFDPSLRQLNKSIKTLRTIVEEVKPDIVQSHFVITTILMRLALRNINIPRIFEVPGPLHLEHWHTRNAELLLAQRNDYWIATCQWTKDRYVKSGINSSKVLKTFYGGDPINYTSDGKKFRAEFGINDDIFLVGMVAYMYPPKRYIGQKRGIKGHEDFIDAIKILQKKYKNIIGVCIGGAWGNAKEYEKSVRKYAKEKGANVIFTGTRNDVKDIYPAFNCAVHPSHSENLGGAGESICAGIPTIATNVGGFPDIVINNKTGLLVNPKDPQAIANAIEFYYHNHELGKSHALSGRNYIIENCNAKKTSKEVYDFYCEILNIPN